VAHVGLITVSDGRPDVHRTIAAFAGGVEDRIDAALRSAGHIVVRADEIVSSNELAVSQARRLEGARPDLTILNIPVWAFPHFTMLAARELSGPILLFSNLDPQYPGMVGMLAAAGALDQIGRVHGRCCGEVEDPVVFASVERQIRAAEAVQRLRGSTFGRIGGRPMGMYTAVSNPDQWMRQFGVDVEEIDQWEIVRRESEVDGDRVRAGRDWFERHTAGVHYDGARLTPELLERQLRSYLVVRELVEERNLDFAGIKAQPELTDHFCTMDVPEALLNDPYDWEGTKAPFICATEADMDAALTMQILQSLSGTPVLFADVRHYDAALEIWDLCNSGQHATWFACRSSDPQENLAQVYLYPAEFYFPAGGASVHHLAAPGVFTFARLTRLDGNYRLQVLPGELVQFDEQTNRRLMEASTYSWPHAFARLDAEADDVLERYGSNHIHAIPGDHVETLRIVSRLVGVEFDGFGSAR
jgi:L-fucose isomerase